MKNEIAEKFADLLKALKNSAERVFWADPDYDNLPKEVQRRIESLPPEVRFDFEHFFIDSFSKVRKKRNVAALIGCFSFITGALPITLGAVGYLWHLRNNRLPELAEKSVEKAVSKYRLGGHTYEPPSLLDDRNRFAPRSRRSESFFNEPEEFDPMNITLNHIKKGYMVDYEMKTWETVAIGVYDWQDEIGEKVLKLSDGVSSIFVWLRTGTEVDILSGKQVNIHAVDSGLEAEMHHNGKPFNMLTYNEITYYLENERRGNFAEESGKNRQQIASWDYLDGPRKHYLRIEQFGREQFKVFTGKVNSSFEFTEILPR